MKKVALVFLFCLIPFLVKADTTIVVGQPVAGGGGATYLLEESFETTPGTDDPDWSGTADPDYTTTVLAGSESLQVTNAGDESYTNALASDQTYVSVYFLVQTGTVGVNNDPVLMLLDSADGEVGSLIFRTANTLRLFHGTETATTVGTVGASTTYHVWVDFNVGATGANYSVAFSTDGTKPSSGNNYASGTTTGSGGANSVRKILLGGSSADNIFDNIKVDDVEIGSNP